MIKLRIQTILRTCLALLATTGLPCVNALQCYTDMYVSGRILSTFMIVTLKFFPKVMASDAVDFRLELE